jgi:hypothetical protein
MYGSTPLDYALEIRNLELIKELLCHLANPFRKVLLNERFAKRLGAKIYRFIREVQLIWMVSWFLTGAKRMKFKKDAIDQLLMTNISILDFSLLRTKMYR